MPVGGGTDEPRLQVVWIAADAVDWPRTERYADSARYQHYAETRGEEDFQALNNDVARVLNEIALSTDRARALELAAAGARRAGRLAADSTRATGRTTSARSSALIDEAIAGLRAADGAHLLRPVARRVDAAGASSSRCWACRRRREQLDQVLAACRLHRSATERRDAAADARWRC